MPRNRNATNLFNSFLRPFFEWSSAIDDPGKQNTFIEAIYNKVSVRYNHVEFSYQISPLEIDLNKNKKSMTKKETYKHFRGDELFKSNGEIFLDNLKNAILPPELPSMSSDKDNIKVKKYLENKKEEIMKMSTVTLESIAYRTSDTVASILKPLNNISLKEKVKLFFEKPPSKVLHVLFLKNSDYLSPDNCFEAVFESVVEPLLITDLIELEKMSDNFALKVCKYKACKKVFAYESGKTDKKHCNNVCASLANKHK